MNKKYLLTHTALALYVVFALLPIVLIFINSFKSQKDIFDAPFKIPSTESFTTIGYQTVFNNSDFLLYFVNSLTITSVSIIFIVLFGGMAAWGVSEYKYRGRILLSLFFIFGMMIPVRLGTIPILELLQSLNLTNTHTALVLVYIAQGLPFSIIILESFIRDIPKEIKDAARCDGVSETDILFHIVFPLLKPALATVTIFVAIPIWNDLWFPLVITPADGKQTLTLGIQQFIGQFITDWPTVLAALSLAAIPPLILYILLSKQLIHGLFAGSSK